MIFSCAVEDKKVIMTNDKQETIYLLYLIGYDEIPLSEINLFFFLLIRYLM